MSMEEYIQKNCEKRLITGEFFEKVRKLFITRLDFRIDLSGGQNTHQSF